MEYLFFIKYNKKIINIIINKVIDILKKLPESGREKAMLKFLDKTNFKFSPNKLRLGFADIAICFK